MDHAVEPQLAIFPIIAVQLILSVALAALSYLLAPKPETEGARPASLGDFKVNTATEGRPIPVIWGTVAMKGPNVIWYGQLRKSPFKDNDVVIGFHYFLGFQFALCHGVIDGVRKIRYGEKYIIYDGSLTKADITVNNRNLYGGDGTGGQGGFIGRWIIYDGAQTTADTYISNRLGSANTPAFKGVAYLVLKDRNASRDSGAYIGNSSNISQFEFTVSRFPNNLGLSSSHHIVGLGANPAEVLYEILTNADWGRGFEAGDINISNFVSIGETLFTEGNGFSFIQDKVTNPIELIKEVERQIDGRLYLDLVTGLFNIKLIRNDYTIGSVPQIDDTNAKLKQFSRGEWSKTYNEVRIPFQDESSDYKDTYALAQDGANFELQGRRRTTQIKFPGVTNRTLANSLAWRELRAVSFPMASATVLVNREFYSVIPGDPVAFSWPDYGISQLPMRVLSIDLGELENGEIELTLAQDAFQFEAGVFADPPASDFVTPVVTVSPFNNPNDQFAIEIPRHIALQQPSGADLAYAIFVGAHSSGGPPLRYEMNYAIPTTYSAVGDVEGLGVQGELRSALVGFTNSMPAQGAGTIVLDPLVESEFALLDYIGAVYTQSMINGEFKGVAVLEPGTSNEEWVIFDSVVADVDGVRLEGVIRGALDTVPKAHSALTRCWIYGPGMALLPVDFAASNNVNVKLLGESDDDMVAIGSATAMNVPMPAANLYRLGKPYAPNELKVNGATRPTSIDGDTDTGGSVPGFTLQWTRRSYGTTKVVNQALGQDDAGSTGWSNLAADGDGNTDLQFNVWIYDLDVTPSPSSRSEAVLSKTSASGATVDSLIVTRAELFAQSAAGHIPSSIRIEIEAIDDQPGGASNNPSYEPLFFDAGLTSTLQTTNAVDLNGSDEYLANTSDSSLGPTSSITLECWVKPRGTAGGTEPGLFILKPSGSFNSAVLLTLSDDSSSSPFRIRLYNSSGTLFKDYSFGSYTPSAWTQLVVTYNGTTLTVYQDGAVDASPTKTLDDAGSLTGTSRQVIVGVDETLASGFLDGLVHRCALWNNVRDAASIAASYNSGDGSGFEPRIDDGGDYDDSSNLMQCYDWRNSSAIGTSYGFHSTLPDVLTNASNISAADLDAGDQP